MSEPAPRGATTIAIHPVLLAVTEGAVVTIVAYDYQGRATTTLPAASLGNGSRLVVLDARAATGPVSDATATLVTSSPPARWFGAPPGTALEFDGTTTVAGVLSMTALTLDGQHDSISLGNSDALNITGTITLEAWIRPSATDELRDIISRGYVTDPQGEVVLRINSGFYQVGSWDGADHIASAPIPDADLGTWVHLAGTYDGTGWLLYRNGVLLAQQQTSVGAVAVAAGWTVGASSDGDRFFAGDIDDVRIWRRPRSALDLADTANRRLDGTEAGLAGYWYFADGAFRDQTSAHNDGTLHGAPKSTASPQVLVAGGDFDVLGDVTVEAWVNPGSASGTARIVQHRSDSSSYLLGLRAVMGALTFDGQTQYATVANSPSLNIEGVLTLEAWIYPTDTAGLRYIVAHGLQPSPQREVALRINAGSYQFGCYDGTDHYAVAAIPSKDVGRWVHLAGVYDGTSWLLYRDGALLASHQDEVGAIPVDAAWAIGASADGQRFFAGRIGEVRLWNLAAHRRRGSRRDPTLVDRHRIWSCGVLALQRDGTRGRHAIPACRHCAAPPDAHRRTVARVPGSRRNRSPVRRDDNGLHRRGMDAPGDDLRPGSRRASRRPRGLSGRGHQEGLGHFRRPHHRGSGRVGRPRRTARAANAWHPRRRWRPASPVRPIGPDQRVGRLLLRRLRRPGAELPERSGRRHGRGVAPHRPYPQAQRARGHLRAYRSRRQVGRHRLHCRPRRARLAHLYRQRRRIQRRRRCCSAAPTPPTARSTRCARR